MMICVLFPTRFKDNSDTTSSVTLLDLKTKRVYEENTMHKMLKKQSMC